MQSKQKTINLSRLILIIKAFVAIEKFPIFAPLEQPHNGY